MKGQRSTLELTAIRRGFELYECVLVLLLVVCIESKSRCITRDERATWFILGTNEVTASTAIIANVLSSSLDAQTDLLNLISSDTRHLRPVSSSHV